MTLNRIQNETHAIQDVLKSFLFCCRRASSQTCSFFIKIWLKTLSSGNGKILVTLKVNFEKTDT